MFQALCFHFYFGNENSRFQLKAFLDEANRNTKMDYFWKIYSDSFIRIEWAFESLTLGKSRLGQDRKNQN